VCITANTIRRNEGRKEGSSYMGGHGAGGLPQKWLPNTNVVTETVYFPRQVEKSGMGRGRNRAPGGGQTETNIAQGVHVRGEGVVGGEMNWRS